MQPPSSLATSTRPSRRAQALGDDRSAWRQPLALAVLATVAWLAMARDVVTGQAPDPWDLRMFAALFSWRHETLTWIMGHVDDVVDVFVGIALAMFLAAQAIRRDWRSLCTLLAVVLGGALLTHVVKALVQRTRPGLDAFLGASGDSFPSGHTIAITLLAGWAIHSAYGATTTRISRLLVASISTTAVLVVAYGRIYMGAHYPSDVAAGVLIGTAWLCTCVAVLRAIGTTDRASATQVH